VATDEAVIVLGARNGSKSAWERQLGHCNEWLDKQAATTIPVALIGGDRSKLVISICVHRRNQLPKEKERKRGQASFFRGAATGTPGGDAAIDGVGGGHCRLEFGAIS
jgi:hypothetical protein